MATVSGLRLDVQDIINSYGTAIRFKYFNTTFVAGSYDDFIVLAQSGNDLWTSGLFQPIQGKNNSSEAFLLEQGKILQNDSKLYILGNVATSGIWRVGIGSQPRNEYAQIENGIESWEVEAGIVYKKLFLKVLPTGSLQGEENT